jgi:hypothetical protein
VGNGDDGCSQKPCFQIRRRCNNKRTSFEASPTGFYPVLTEGCDGN